MLPPLAPLETLVGAVLLCVSAALLAGVLPLAATMLWVTHRGLPLNRQLRILESMRVVSLLIGTAVLLGLLLQAWPYLVMPGSN